MDLLTSILSTGAEVASYTKDMQEVFLQSIVAALVAFIIVYSSLALLRRKGKPSMSSEERRIFVETFLKEQVLYAVREAQRRSKVTPEEAELWIGKWELLKDPQKRRLKDILNNPQTAS